MREAKTQNILIGFNSHRLKWTHSIKIVTTQVVLRSNRFSVSYTRQSWEKRDKKTGTVHRFEWDNGLPLNNANFDLKVNMLKYEETDKKGKTKRFSWVTDLSLDRDTVMPIMRAGRRRWAIENEAIKTLKDRRGYNFGHN